MARDLFPPAFPPELSAAAFRATNEVAWNPALAVTAVDWLGTHGYAVLGTELWLVQGDAIQSLAIGLSGMREVHGNTVNRESGEPWISFVARASKETRSYLDSFKPSDIAEAGEVYFNVVWVSEDGFKNLRSAGH